MRKDVDFSNAVLNPHFESLSKEISFRLDFHSIEYFRQLGEPYGLSAEDMIYRYLRHIAGSNYKADLGLLSLDQLKELRESQEEEGKLPRKA